MQELTTAVSEEEVINFFINIIVPHVMRFQKPALHANNVVATPSSQSSSQGKENFMSRLVNKLESVVENSPTEQVCNNNDRFNLSEVAYHVGFFRSYLM